MKFWNLMLMTAVMVSHASNCWAGGCLSCNKERCDKTCSPEWVTKKIAKSCFYIECKDICIPAVRFPWDKCSTPKYGKVITVKLLKKRKYKCEKCSVQWNIHGYCDSCTSCVPDSLPYSAPTQLPPLPGLQPSTPPKVPAASTPAAASTENTGTVRLFAIPTSLRE